MGAVDTISLTCILACMDTHVTLINKHGVAVSFDFGDVLKGRARLYAMWQDPVSVRLDTMRATRGYTVPDAATADKLQRLAARGRVFLVYGELGHFIMHVPFTVPWRKAMQAVAAHLRAQAGTKKTPYFNVDGGKDLDTVESMSHYRYTDSGLELFEVP